MVNYMASIILGGALLTEQRELKKEEFEARLSKDKKTVNKVFKTLLIYWGVAFISTTLLIGLYLLLFTPAHTPDEPYNFIKMLSFFGIIFIIVFIILYDTIMGEIPFMTMFITSQYILSSIHYPNMNDTQSLITGTVLYITISLTTLTIIYYKMRKDGVYLIYSTKNTEKEN